MSDHAFRGIDRRGVVNLGLTFLYLFLLLAAVSISLPFSCCPTQVIERSPPGTLPRDESSD